MSAVEWFFALIGASGLTGAGLFTYSRGKSARRRARNSANPLAVHREEDLTEPGPDWALVSPEVLERRELAKVVIGENQGSWTPNRFRRDAQQRWGTYDAGRTVVALTILNKREIPLYVTALSAVIENVDPTPRGTLIENPPQGAMEVRNFQIHLDGGDLRAMSPTGGSYCDPTSWNFCQRLRNLYT